MQKYLWSRLNKYQAGVYTKYCALAEFAMYGFQLSETDEDDQGIFLVAEFNNNLRIEVLTRYLRKIPNPVYAQKRLFPLSEHVFLALALLFDGKPPLMYLIPSTRWLKLDSLFVDRTYSEHKSKPEWGLNITSSKLAALEDFRFDITVEHLINSI